MNTMLMVSVRDVLIELSRIGRNQHQRSSMPIAFLIGEPDVGQSCLDQQEFILREMLVGRVAAGGISSVANTRRSGHCSWR